MVKWCDGFMKKSAYNQPSGDCVDLCIFHQKNDFSKNGNFYKLTLS